jgi:hypothetical protein
MADEELIRQHHVTVLPAPCRLYFLKTTVPRARCEEKRAKPRLPLSWCLDYIATIPARPRRWSLISPTTQSPAANAAGGNNTDITVDWKWSDDAGGSGIDGANCTTTSTSSGEGNPITLQADAGEQQLRDVVREEKG